MRDQLAAYFASHQKLVEPGVLQMILETAQPLDLSRRLIEVAGPETPFVTVEMVRDLTDPARSGARLFAGRPPAPVPPPSDAPVARYALIEEGFLAPTASHAPLEAYGALFASRFRSLSRLLRGRPELSGARTVQELRRTEGNAAVIGMVRDVRQTAEKHHLILQLEDATGAIELLVPRDSPAARQTYLPDEVVGVTVVLPKDAGKIPRVTGIQRPEVPASRKEGRSGRPSRALFLSDLHIGSRSFMDGPWGELMEFLRGRGPDPEVAAEISHVVVAGDLVDGIGIYPNQERDLAIPDVFEQYAELGRRLRELPERLNVVVIPGNHDAVCPAEPQPGLPTEFRSKLPDNVHSVGNPSTFALDGVVVEAYHGRSFDDLIPALPGASYSRPTEVMRRMLAMRHLAPIYGGRTPLAPLPRDGLVVDPAPDILVTGHSHTFGMERDRGILLLNASTWQSTTEYQRMRNIEPVPARAAVVDLTNLQPSAYDFSAARPVPVENPA